MVTPTYFNYGGLLIAGIVNSINWKVEVSKQANRICELGNDKDVIGLSFQSTTEMLRAGSYLRELRKRFGNLLVAGGPAVLDYIFAHKILPEIDVFVLGEGEDTIKEVLQTKDNDELKHVRGIAFVVNEKLLETEKRSPIQLSKRPLPFIPLGLGEQIIRGVNIYVETHRGCVGNCIFCQYCEMFDSKIRTRPIEDIIAEIKYFVMHGVKKIAFSGGDISLYGFDLGKQNEKCFMELLKRSSEIVGKDNLAGPDIRIDNISNDILKSIKKYTTGWVFVGIESGSERIQRMIRKNISLDEVHTKLRFAKRNGVKVVGSFMTGFIGEMRSDFSQTKELIEELNLDETKISIAEPLPGTKYWEVSKNCPLEQNPLFMPKEEYSDVENFSLSEEWTMILLQTAYKTKHRRSMSKTMFNKKVLEVKKEAKRIRSIVIASKTK
jgi:tRNA-2-methylthio-N6-dimethylallyladenosine synthase